MLKRTPMLVLALAAVVMLAAPGRADEKEPAAAPDSVAAHLAAADRYAGLRPSMPDLEKGEAEIKEALRLDPKSYEATWRMARMLYYLGKYGSEDKRLERYDSGIEWAKKAVALDPKRVEGQFWLGVCYGVYGETRGIMASLFLVGDMKEALEKANEIDPNYDGGGPPRVLGRLYYKLPWFKGGSNEKSIEYLRKAMKIDPTMPYNYTYLAEVLIDEDEDKEAKELFDKLLAMNDGRWAPELEEAKGVAKKLLKDME